MRLYIGQQFSPFLSGSILKLLAGRELTWIIGIDQTIPRC